MKFKKLFLGLVASVGLLSAAATTVNGAETGLTQNFDYSADGLGAYGGSNAYDIYGFSGGSNEYLRLEQHDGADGLYFGLVAEKKEQTPKVQIRDSGAGNSVFNQEGKSAVIKTRFKQVRGHSKCFYINASDLGTQQITNIKSLQHGNGSLDKAEWHELTVVIAEGGEANDMIYAYADGKLIQTIDVQSKSKTWTGKINEIGFQLGKATFNYDEALFIDYVTVSEYVAPVSSITETTKEVTVGSQFEIAAPTLDNANAPVANYNVEVADDKVVKYENGKFEAVAEGTTTVKFNYVDELIADQVVTVTVKAPVGAIEVSNIQMNVFAEKIQLGVGQQFQVNNLFTAEPAAADNKELAYTITSGSEYVSLENGVLKGVANGTATLKVSSTDGSNVTKEVTVEVLKGNFVDLNNYEVGQTWTPSQDNVTQFTGWQPLGYSKYKQYANIEVVADPVFGKALSYTFDGVESGPAGATAGGAGLITHIPAEKLTANKDYKLYVWVKAEDNGVKNPNDASYARVDLKLYGYEIVDGVPSYKSGLPYSTNTSKQGITGTGWQLLELGTVNLDETCIDGIRVELVGFQLIKGMNVLISNAQLVEVDTVNYVSFNATANGEAFGAEEVELTLGNTMNVATTAIPSAAQLPSLTYTVADDSVLSYENGVLTAVGIGKTTLTITDGKTTKTLTVNVTNEATNVTVDNTNLELQVGDYEEYQLVVTPTNATSQFEAVSSNPEGLSVVIESGNLAIMANAAGTYTVTVTSLDNSEVKVVINVVVSEVPTLTLGSASATIKVGETVQINAVVTPAGTVTYTVADATVATVDANGLVTAVKAGTTTVTVTYGDLTETFTVTVEEEAQPDTPNQPENPDQPEQPGDDQPGTEEPAEKGCFGSLASSLIALVTLTGAVVLAKKRREDK